MADTRRSLVDLQSLLADNTSGDISAQDVRDFLVSVYQPQALAGGRLTLESGVPVSTSDQTAKTSLYYTPYIHDQIGLYDGTSWKLYAFTEITLALGTLTSGKNYDVFLYDSSGTLTLELLAWTDDTTRATALALTNGVYLKTGALTRRYVGTIRTTATTTTEDSEVKRFVFNANNRLARKVYKNESANSWTYTSATWRQARAQAANQVEVVVGLQLDVLDLVVWVIISESVSGAYPSAGIGINQTANSDAPTYGTSTFMGAAALANAVLSVTAAMSHIPRLGYSFYAWVERTNQATGTVTWYSSDTTDRQRTAAIRGTFWC